MTLVDALRAELLTARRARDAAATSAVRTALAALANAEAVPGEYDAMGNVGVGASDVDRREVGEDEQRVLVEAEVADLERAATAYDGVDDARAEAARHGAAVLRRVLATG